MIQDAPPIATSNAIDAVGSTEPSARHMTIWGHPAERNAPGELPVTTVTPEPALPRHLRVHVLRDSVVLTVGQNTVKYTNMNPTTITVDWRGHFTPSVPNRPAYVQSHALGLIAGGFNAKLVRGSTTVRNDRGTCSSAASRDNPIQMDCEQSIHATGPFNHGDKLQITADFTNGGYVTVYNRDAGNRHEKNYYSGSSTTTNTAEFVFDYVAPTCTGTQLNIGDSVSKQCGAGCTTNCVQAARGPCYKKDYVITFDRSQVDVGGHDHDYLLTLTVRNKATLSTTETLKITVDTSPPLAGNVHDGMKGQPEKDYQQTTAVKTWWDGFFDEESGVKFYLYGYSTSCLTAADFTLPEGASITRTTNTHATYTAPSAGTYFCTVVAYNHALDPSPPVCSDGVTVDVTAPSLTAIHIDHIAVRPGVVKDAGGNVWLINQRRHRVLVLDPPAQCLSVPQVNYIDDFAPRRDFVTNTTLTAQYCTRHSGAPTGNYLSMDKTLRVAWHGEDDGGIYDYFVGLSSTSSGTSSPDIMAFTSTTSIPELRFSHPRISQNSLFHLVIKAEDRAGLSTTKVVGPIVVDVSPPQFTGRITLSKEGNFYVGRWTGSDFFDDESQDPLTYEFAVGGNPSSTAMLRFRHVGANGPCTSANPPNCAAIGTDALDGPPSDSYYMFVRVTNPASLSVIGISSAYSIHDKLPANGVVFDVAPDMNDDPGSHDYEDIDSQTDNGVLHARWFGFSHDPTAVTYEVAVGTTSGAEDVRAFTAAAGTTASITGLTLEYFQTYFITVRATSDAGSVTVSSDGVTVLEYDGRVGGMMVKDGPGCFEHTNDTCEDDAEYQRSTSTMWVRWNTPSNITDFLSEFYWTIEEEIRDGSDSRAFTKLGCWRDKGNAAITPLEGTDPRLDGNFAFRENAIEKCYQVARSRGATVFALQSGGECFGSADGHSTYNMYGPSTLCAEDGKGGSWANEVYQITGQTQYLV
uniref:Fibronectin type-III domain-containing protein n=1 Tax=Branchiostoma floridae TaxID=7739 RepID=C3YYM0_BRAFL|eukprot:XP_002598648.1 hypothetical protein BRAFLDRAFT_67046 [Branchiostoma floridae]